MLIWTIPLLQTPLGTQWDSRLAVTSESIVTHVLLLLLWRRVPPILIVGILTVAGVLPAVTDSIGCVHPWFLALFAAGMLAAQLTLRETPVRFQRTAMLVAATLVVYSLRNGRGRLDQGLGAVAGQLTRIKAGGHWADYCPSMVAPTLFDLDLQSRYDLPGPRYTSYPPAPRFSENFSEADLRQAAQASNDEPLPRPLALYVHVPFCTSPCFYCGCNRIITRDRARGEAYLVRLHREIALYASLFDRDRRVVQVHFGGGTPNFLSPAQLGDTVDVLRSHFRFDGPRDIELSIELDPRFLADGDVAALAAAGFNRTSLGVQDFDADVQDAVNRVQSVEETLAAIEACRRHGFRSVNLDLIYGLPRQTVAGFARTLETVIAARPDRLAVYAYSHLPRMFRPQRQIAAAELPPPRTKLELLQLAVSRLTDAGYCYIGMDHFALPTDELSRSQERGDLHRNFMGYTTCAASDLLGFGVSAISHIGDSYSQNPRALPAWQAAIDAGRLPAWRGAWLDDDDRIRADLIQQLMCLGSFDMRQLEHRYGIRFDEYFAEALVRLRPLVRDGLATVSARSVSATPRGRLLLRIIAMCFDRYHATQQ